MAKRREITPMDQGYAWVILLASSALYMILSGVTKAFGILYTEFLDRYDSGAGNTAWISSVQVFFFFSVGPVANHLVERFSFRTVIMSGGLLMSTGYFITAFVPRMEWMYLTIGIVGGLGGGLIYAPCTALVSFYFEKRRAFANGIMLSGSGLGSFGFSFFYRYIIDRFGLHGAMMLISGILFNSCVAGALIRQPSQLIESKRVKDIEVEAEIEKLNPQLSDISLRKRNKTRQKKPIVDFSLLRIPRLTMYVVSLTINIIGYVANFSVFPAHVAALGYGDNKVAIALSMVGATEIFARSFFGWLADLKIVQKKTLMLFSAAVSGVCAIFIPFLRNFPAMIGYGCVVGIFPGAFWSLMAVVMLDCVELERLPSTMGLLSMFLSLGIIISQPLMGWIEDATGNWDLSFRIMGICYLTSGVILLLEPAILKLWCCDQDEMHLVESADEQRKTLIHAEGDDSKTSCFKHPSLCDNSVILIENYRPEPEDITSDVKIKSSNGEITAPMVSIDNI